MKKTILALAAALVAGSALATTPPVVNPAVGSVTGSATSQVGGGTASYSFGTGLNISARHGSMASAQNCTVAAGYSIPGTDGAQAGTLAYTAGTTLTSAAGTATGAGAGGYAGSDAFQFGSAVARATANVGSGLPAVGSEAPVGTNPYGVASATSSAVTGTFSNALVGNVGNATAGSAGGAENQTDVLVGSSLTTSGVSTRAEGLTVGENYLTTTGSYSGEGATSTAGGMLSLTVGNAELTNVGSFQNGTFEGTIVRTFTTPTTGTGGPGGCTSGDCGGGDGDHPGGGGGKPNDKPNLKGNNGWGNGDQTAPGNSGPHNQAENNANGRIQRIHGSPTPN